MLLDGRTFPNAVDVVFSLSSEIMNRCARSSIAIILSAAILSAQDDRWQRSKGLITDVLIQKAVLDLFDLRRQSRKTSKKNVLSVTHSDV